MDKENINRYRKLGLSESGAIAMAKLDEFHEAKAFEFYLSKVLISMIKTNSEGITDVIASEIKKRD